MDDATPAAGDGPRQTSRAGFGPAFCLEGEPDRLLEVGSLVGNAFLWKNKRA